MMLGTPEWTPAENTLFLHEMMLHGQFLDSATPQGTDKQSNRAARQGADGSRPDVPRVHGGRDMAEQGPRPDLPVHERQLYSDGGQAEETPGYQGNVLSNLLDPYELSAMNGVPWRRTQYRQLINTAQSLYQLLQPDGTEPALSDTYRASGLSIINSRIAAARYAGDGVHPRADSRRVQARAGRGAQTFSVTGTEDLAGRGLDYAMPVSGYWITRSGEDRQARQIDSRRGPDRRRDAWASRFAQF